MTIKNILETHNLSKKFADVTVLKQVSLTVERGEVHVLLGANGAGKSTLIKILLGIIQRDFGDVIFNSQKKFYTSTREAYADGMAAVFQETSLIPQLTALENVFLGNEIIHSLYILDKKRMTESFHRTCNQFNLKLDPDKPVYSMGITEKKNNGNSQSSKSKIQLYLNGRTDRFAITK